MTVRILCVDDDSNVLQSYRRALRKRLQIDTALSGEEALRAMDNQGPYAVVVSDMRMPGMNGVEFLKRVKVNAPDTVRMMLTGHADLRTVLEAINDGYVFRFITKPCPPDQFARVLEAGLAQYRLITAERSLVAQLSDAKQQMESFLAAAAHDLRSPLITIAHNATFARKSLENGATEVAKHLDRIQSAEKDMLNLLDQLSEVSRAGRDTEPRKVHSFRELAQSAVRQLEGTLAERQANVVVDGNLPELCCQGTKFVQVFCNLISNAVKYTPAGRTPHVEVGYQLRPRSEHVFFVRDNGSGIPEECLPKVFDLFKRLSTDQNIPGQGVGLTVVKRIVEVHGGRVWVESIPDEGSTFYFTVGQQRENDYDCHGGTGSDLLAGRR